MKTKAKSNRRKASPERIRQAQYAKQHGLLSKSANLAGGKISPAVAKKLNALESLRAVPTYEKREGAKRATIMDPATRTGLKLSPAQAKEAKQRGFEVFNRNIIVAKTDLPRAKKALSKGHISGTTLQPSYDVKNDDGLKRVSKGAVERISLSKFNINNFRDLYLALEANRLEKVAKLPTEVYAFTLYDFHPRPERHTKEKGETNQPITYSQISHYDTYEDDAALLAYLERYAAMNNASDDPNDSEAEDLFNNFELLRMELGESLGPTPDWVYRLHGKKKSTKRQDRRRAVKARSQQIKKERAAMTEENRLEKLKLKARERRQNETWEQRNARLERDALSQRQRRENKEGKKRSPRPDKRKY